MYSPPEVRSFLGCTVSGNCPRRPLHCSKVCNKRTLVSCKAIPSKLHSGTMVEHFCECFAHSAPCLNPWPRFSTSSFSLKGKKTWSEGFSVIQQSVDGSGDIRTLENYVARALAEKYRDMLDFALISCGGPISFDHVEACPNFPYPVLVSKEGHSLTTSPRKN